MTFTYTPAAPTDITRIRFHLGDTVEPSKFTDEEIAFVLAENNNSIGETVIAMIIGLIARLSGDPNFTADWLTVDNATAIEGLKSLLKIKAAVFGLSVNTATFVPVYRLDSDQTAGDLDYVSGGGSEWA